MLPKYVCKSLLIFLMLFAHTCLQAQIINTVAGNGMPGYSGDFGPATAAQLNFPNGVALDSTGNFLYIADTTNNRIRRVNLGTGIITTVAGNGMQGYSGDGGPATAAELNLPSGVALDSTDNFLYIADQLNNRIRQVNLKTHIITTIAGNGKAGFNGDNIPATSAKLNNPTDVAIHGSSLYIADFLNQRIRQVNLQTNIITTIAGNGMSGYFGDGGSAVTAELSFPEGVAVDSKGNFLYIADSNNNIIRQVDLHTGIINRIAGNIDTNPGYSGDNGPATDAELNNPTGVFVDSTRNLLYIADNQNNVIRQVDLTKGIITTVAGNFNLGPGYSGDGGAAIKAQLNGPISVSVDNLGNLYIADAQNSRIREVSAPVVNNLSPNTGHVSGGTVVNVAGSGFVEVSQVFFGSTPAVSFTVNSDQSITAVSPPGAGAVSVRVVTSFATSADTPGSQFFYALVPLPTISSISPNTGPSTGGTVVTITGNQFINVNQVLFGQTPAASFTVNSQSSITAVSPPGTGTVDVRIVISDIMSPVTPADQFTYFTPLPSPPEHLKGRQVRNRFVTQTDIVNIITWRTPLSGEAPVAYKIYRDAALTELTQTVRAEDRHRFKFKDHNRREHKTYTYFIVSVDAAGNQSVASSVTVGH